MMTAVKKTTLFVFLGLSVWLAGSMASAQTPVPPDEDLESRSKKKAPEIDKHIKEIADDYRELLEELAFLSRDYGEFFRDYQSVEATKNAKALNRFNKKIIQGAYYGNLSRLTDDLKKVTESLAAQEQTLRHEKESRRVYATVRTLRQELEIFNELILQEVEQRLRHQTEELQKIQQYLDEWAKSENGSKIRSGLLLDVKSDQKRIEAIVMELPDEEELAEMADWDLGIVYVPEPMPLTELLIDTIFLPEAPPAPVIVEVSPDRELIYIGKGGKIALVKEFTGNSSDIPEGLPVLVKNPIGNVSISGWDGNSLTARLEVNISAESKQAARDLAGNMSLEICKGSDGLRVEPRIPSLADLKTRILSSTLSIRTPSANKLLCETSFGTLQISGLRNDLEITGNNCSITAVDIVGDVKAYSDIGGVMLSEITGKSTVKCALGSITITGCDGDLKLESSLASISVFQSTGDARIDNSGEVKVFDHVGAIVIKNGNGQVEVKKLQGNLEARNSYKPLLVEQITGDIVVENSNSTIDARYIDGGIVANNRFGSIVAAVLRGPLKLTNHNGDITVTLDKQVQGESFISTSWGNINLALSEKSNLALTAETLGGNIHSFVPVSVIEKGGLMTAELSFGRATNSLNISGDNAVINISKAP